MGFVENFCVNLKAKNVWQKILKLKPSLDLRFAVVRQKLRERGLSDIEKSSDIAGQYLMGNVVFLGWQTDF